VAELTALATSSECVEELAVSSEGAEELADSLEFVAELEEEPSAGVQKGIEPLAASKTARRSSASTKESIFSQTSSGSEATKDICAKRTFGLWKSFHSPPAATNTKKN